MQINSRRIRPNMQLRASLISCYVYIHKPAYPFIHCKRHQSTPSLHGTAGLTAIIETVSDKMNVFIHRMTVKQHVYNMRLKRSVTLSKITHLLLSADWPNHKPFFCNITFSIIPYTQRSISRYSSFLCYTK
jgi:hypothetical protein